MNRLFSLVFLLISVLSVSAAKPPTLSASCTTAFGPGLDPRIIVTKRHFTIQLCAEPDLDCPAEPSAETPPVYASDYARTVGCHGNQYNLTSSPWVDYAVSPMKGAVVMATMEGVNWRNGPIRNDLRVADRGDGTLYADFLVFSPMSKVQISVTLNGSHIKGSPFSLPVISADPCSCPVSPEEFKQTFQCPKIDAKLRQGLSRFPQGIERDTIAQAAGKLASPSTAVMHYVIKDNKLYGKNLTEIAGFRTFFDRAFNSLARKVRLPDSEFLINLGDWPLVNPARPGEARDTQGRLFPLLSGCVEESSGDILLPTWVMLRYIFNEAVEDVHGIDAGSYGVAPWAKKQSKLFWRGRDANRERLALVEMAKRQPDLLDAGITNYFFFRDREASLGRVSSVGFIDFWNSKYMLNVDGTVAAYRLMASLAGNSVVFKQDSPYQEWFYHKLKPFVHYVPVKRDLSDVVERVKWAQEHDDEAQKIARNARLLMREEMTPERIYCHLLQVLEEYSKLLKFPVERDPTMDEVPHPPTTFTCTCPPTQPTKQNAAKPKATKSKAPKQEL